MFSKCGAGYRQVPCSAASYRGTAGDPNKAPMGSKPDPMLSVKLINFGVE